MRLRAILCSLSLALTPLTASASYVSVTGGASATKQTTDNPRSGDESASVSGSVDLSESWSLDFSTGLTHIRRTAQADVVVFPDKGNNNIFSFSAGPSWMPGEHWMSSLLGTLAPSNTAFSQSVVMLEGPKGGTVDYDAQLKSKTSSGGLLFSLSYDTAGESNWEHGFGVNFGWNHLNSEQSITKVVDRKGTEIDLKSSQACPAGAKGAACRRLQTLTKPQSAALNQFSLNAFYTATLLSDTDLTLGGTYYLYDTDPNQLGYFSVASAGRANKAASNGEVSFGSGVPLAPFLFGTSVSLAHYFGEEHKFRVALNGGYNAYDGQQGYNLNGGLKIAYKFNKHWKATLLVGGARDIDLDGNVIPTVSASAGVRYTF